MKQVGRIMWGIVLVFLGVIFSLKALNIVDIDLFFPGWWTFFIIIPSFISFFTDHNKAPGIVGLIIGFTLLLSRLGILDIRMLWKLLIPVSIIIIGLELIFRDAFGKSSRENVKKLSENLNSSEKHSAVFSSQSVDFSGQQFSGTVVKSVFGNMDINIENALFNTDVVIKATCFGGKIKIKVPSDVNVKTVSSSLFGRVTDCRNKPVQNGLAVVYVKTGCFFGNVDII